MTRDVVFLLIVLVPFLALFAWLTWKVDGPAIKCVMRRWFGCEARDES